MLIIRSYNPSKYIIQSEKQEIAQQNELNALLGEAYSQMQENNLNGAEKTLHLLLRNTPYNSNALLLLGNIFFMQEKYAEAEETYTKLIKHSPPKAINYNNLGQTLAMQEKYFDAVMNFKKAIELDPNSYYAHLNLAEVYIKINRKKLAIAELKKAFELQKKHGSISINMDAFEALKNEKDFRDLLNKNFNSGDKK